MNEFSIELPILIAATLTLSLGATLAWVALSWIQPKGHRLHRFVWMAVLLQGIMLAKISVDLPVFDAETSQSVASFFGELPKEATLANDFQNNITNDIYTSIEKSTTENRTLNSLTEAGRVAQDGNLTAPPSKATDFDLILLLKRVWLGGICVAIGYVVLCYLRVLQIAKCSHLAPFEWNRQCKEICKTAGLTKTIPLLTHDQIGPALILTPLGYRIIVPEEFWNEMNESQRAAVLRHEIEHYRRSDITVSIFARLIASVHWFNPFAWLAVHRLDAAAEWACDEAAASLGSQPSDFARALLSISTANSKHLVGAYGIGSSDTKTRIKRLLEGAGRTSRIGNMAITTLAMIILFSGWINLRLITESAIAKVANLTHSDDSQLEKNIEQFGGQLTTNGTANQRLKKLIDSTSGKIAIANSVADIENAMRNEATKDVVLEFFEDRVDRDFRLNVAKDAMEAQLYIRELSEAIEKFKNEFRGTTDADKLFLRFLNSKDAATVLYFGEIRKQIQPDQQLLMRHLGRFLAQNNDGRFIVRESAKAPLSEKLSTFNSADEHISFLKEELALLGTELMPSDELHKKCKKRLLESRGAAFVIATAFNDPGQLENHVTNYLQELDNLFEDAPEGLVIADDARKHLSNGMREMDRLVSKMERLRNPIASVVKKIDASDGEMENQVKKFLSSEIGLAVLSMQIEIEDSDATAVVERMRNEVLEETDEGLVVRSDRHAEISEFSRRMLKGARNLRRQLRIVDTRTAKIPKDKTEGLLDSTESKMILVEKVKLHAQQLQFDGWPTWLETHFEKVDGKYSVKTESEELIQHLSVEAAAIEKELSNDDF